MFLFFDKKKGRWMFGPSLGSSKGVEYGSGEFSTAKCPADPARSGRRQGKYYLCAQIFSVRAPGCGRAASSTGGRRMPHSSLCA